MTDIETTPAKWDRKKAQQLTAIARQLFRCDMHDDHDEYRESCGACCLKGYLSESAIADGIPEDGGPNYAGWARCYVQALRPVPLKWLKAFLGQLESDNLLYAEALKTDIATYGLRFSVNPEAA